MVKNKNNPQKKKEKNPSVQRTNKQTKWSIIIIIKTSFNYEEKKTKRIKKKKVLKKIQ